MKILKSIKKFLSKYIDFSFDPKAASGTNMKELNLFGNWILKHYETHTDESGSFCWISPTGVIKTTPELVEEFKMRYANNNL